MATDEHRAWVRTALGVSHRALSKGGGGVSSGKGSGPSGDATNNSGAIPPPSLPTKNPGETAKFPDASGPARRPLRVRTIRLQFRVPASYDELRELVEARFARELMSRTVVEQPDGSRAPIHREREFVAESNLRQLHRLMRPGESLEITARMIPGAGGNRYERLVFALPEGYVPAGDEESRVSARSGIRGLAGPDYQPPHPPPHRDDNWRRAQQILEEQLGGATVGGDPDVMWTPTATGISRMMPAVPGLTEFGSGGDAVPGQARQTNPRWRVMPPPLGDTARVLGQMLLTRFNRNRMFGADDLPEGEIRSVVKEFIAAARAAKAMRNDRLARLDAATSVGGGQAMFADDLRHYMLAEVRLFEGDPTCLWRYVN